MGRAEFLSELDPYVTVAVDSNSAIYYLNSRERRYGLMRALMERAATAEVAVRLSAMTRLELLVQPLRERNHLEQRKVLVLTEGTPGIQVMPISSEVIDAAADIRARTNLKVPDAIIAGCAIVYGCEAIVGNDGAFRRLATIPAEDWAGFDPRRSPIPAYIHLDDFVD